MSFWKLTAYSTFLLLSIRQRKGGKCFREILSSGRQGWTWMQKLAIHIKKTWRILFDLHFFQKWHIKKIKRLNMRLNCICTLIKISGTSLDLATEEALFSLLCSDLTWEMNPAKSTSHGLKVIAWCDVWIEPLRKGAVN